MVAKRDAPPAGFIEPCLPTVAAKPSSGDDWLHEIKHDGYRLMVRRREGRVRLFTRRGFDWTGRFPWIVDGLQRLRCASVLIDGEAVYCGPDGVSDFDKLHSQAHNDRVFLYGFDLLELDGKDLRQRPLEERKRRLAKLLRGASSGIRQNEHVEGDGAEVFRAACKLGLEGIVSKHRERPYRSGRSKTWIKIKNPASPAMLRIEEGTW